MFIQNQSGKVKLIVKCKDKTIKQDFNLNLIDYLI